MGGFRLSLAFSTLIFLTNAFTVDFWSADHCVGSVVGYFEGVVGQGCQTTFSNYSDSNNLVTAPGGSFNVVPWPSANDKKTGVAFYGESDCKTLIALGNVNICLGTGAYTSFEVIDFSDSELGYTNLEPAPVQNLPTNATETANPREALTDIASAVTVPSTGSKPTITGSASIVTTNTLGTSSGNTLSTSQTSPLTASSLSSSTASSMSASATTSVSTSTAMKAPAARLRRKREAKHAPVPRSSLGRSIEQMRNGKPVAHGEVRRSAAQAYAFQQVAKRAWRGVPLKEWDANIHKRNEVDVASSRSQLSRRGDGTSRRDLGPLRERAISAANCNMVRSCMIDSGNDPKFTIDDVGAQLLDAIHALNPTQEDWTWLQRPFVVEIVDSAGKSEGLIYAQTLEHSEAVNTCSDARTERDALQAALAMGIDGSTVTDMRVDLKLLSGTGVTNSLFVSTRSVGNSDMRIHPICEAVQVNY